MTTVKPTISARQTINGRRKNAQQQFPFHFEALSRAAHWNAALPKVFCFGFNVHRENWPGTASSPITNYVKMWEFVTKKWNPVDYGYEGSIQSISTPADVALRTTGEAILVGASANVVTSSDELKVHPTEVQALYLRLYTVYGCKPATVICRPTAEAICNIN